MIRKIQKAIRKFRKIGEQRFWVSHRRYLRAEHELKYLFWECTLNCNFACKHCGSKAGEKLIQEVVSTDDIKKAFLDISKNFNAKEITVAVTGGEPLLRKDLFEVMKYATGLGFNWGMVSNAFLINEEVIEKFKKSKMRTIDISIDGIGTIHDDFRNKKGAYEKAIQAVKSLAKEDFLKPLRITTTVHKNNIDSLEEMYKTFSALGISDWRVINVDPIGRADENKDILLDKDQLKKLLNFIKNKREKKSKVKVIYSCPHFLGDEYEGEVRNSFFFCSTGINIGSILHNGDIFVCPNVPRQKKLIQGNIKHDSFSDVWKNKFNFFRNANRTSSKICLECEHWQECLGGSLHTWDFEKKHPKVCFMSKDFYLNKNESKK